MINRSIVPILNNDDGLWEVALVRGIGDFKVIAHKLTRTQADMICVGARMAVNQFIEDNDLTLEVNSGYRVVVNPFGGDGNIFIVDAEGSPRLIVAKHPVWRHLEEERLPLAHHVVRRLNNQETNSAKE